MPALRRTSTRAPLIVAAVAALLLAIGLPLYWKSALARKKRELAYHAIVSSYARDLPPGMSRKAVDEYLNAKNLAFTYMCCLGDHSEYYVDQVKLGEESDSWYCSATPVYAAFEFSADVLKTIELYEPPEGCK